MALPATGIAYITLKPAVDVCGATPDAKIWQEAVGTVASQDGFQRCFYGQQLEDPSLLLFVIDWESKDSHLKFMNAPYYEPFKSGLTSIMQDVHLHHITQPDIKLLGLAPVVEFANFYDVEPTMLSNVENLAAALEKAKPKRFHGIVYGEVMEKIVRPRDVGKEDIKPGSAIVGMIGWDSKDAYLAFRETELFKKNIGLLREKNGGAEIGHVPFKAF